MEIQYLGHASFLIKCGKIRLVTDPFNSEVGFDFPSTEASIVTVSHHHHDHDALGAIKGAPLVLDMAGEYEKEEVRITGWETFHDDSEGSERGKNVIFKIEYGGASVLHLGDLGHQLSSDLLEEIGSVDVLLVPVGGVYTINAEEATKIVRKIEPNIDIPMHFKTPAHSEKFETLSTEESFLQKSAASISPIDSLKVVPGQESDDTEVVLLTRVS